MGACRHCGEPAGLMRSAHKECKERDRQAKERQAAARRSIVQMCKAAAVDGEGLDELPDRMMSAAAKGGLSLGDAQECYRMLADGWCQALSDGLEDSHLSDTEIANLNAYRIRLKVPEDWLNLSGDFDTFRLAVTLRHLSNGTIPRFGAPRSQLPFNLMKSEEMVALFDDVQYGKEVTRREYRGQSMGASIRLAKGLYLRPGTFRGKPIETTSMEHQDHGTLGLTTKHIYYIGESTGRSFRIRLEKIVSFNPCSNGLELMRDTASAKPEAFVMGSDDAWFLINAIHAVLDLDEVSLPGPGDPTADELLAEGADDDDSDIAGFAAAGGMVSLDGGD